MKDEFGLSDFGLVTYSVAGGAQSAGLAIDGRIIALSALANTDPEGSPFLNGSVYDIVQHWDRAWPLIEKAAAVFRASTALQSVSVAEDAVRLHAPITSPRAIYCAGGNYRKHVIDIVSQRFVPKGQEHLSNEEVRARAAAEVDARAREGEPFFFNKNIPSLVGPYDDLFAPALATQMDWELELGVVIGRSAWCVSVEDALDHVAGYVVAHDVSTRDRMFRDGAVGADFLQAKGLPTFFPLGPYLTPKAHVPDPQALRIVLKLNGEAKQDESTADMIFGVAKLISYLSKWVKINPGDIIATGSPAGNGTYYNRYLKPGDVIEGAITGLGTQRNRIVEDVRP
ncbi:MAG TPA: fumarylacetoacetate hydrolase family protein [Caulobacteraceae bacterium]|nr:fumarylacetoacetate hydrolase family protein [Caulobacteraceae bacterium]